MTDGTPFEITQKWETVWSTDFPREYFSPFVQQIIKTGLTIIVAARCGTTYPYAVSAMVVIFCVLKDRTPKLILPWLFIAGVKSVCMTFCEALIGVYVCSAFGKIHKACIEFFITKALEIVFAAYLWGSVLSVYQDLERRAENKKILKNPEITYIKKMDLKRQRARSLLDESTLYKTACLNNFEFKDVPRIILQMLRRADEMSQDSLLGPGMMLASVSNMGSFDNLKTSESLGELGSTNLQSTKVIGLDEEENLSPPEKALKFLKMTWSDVRMVQPRGKTYQSDIFSINSDTWFDVTNSDARIYKPKQARTEVFIRELPEMDLEEDQRFRKNSLKKIYGIKVGVSLFNLIKKNEFDYDEDEESFVESQEEVEEIEEEDEGEEGDLNMSPIFMSNINEEKPVNRIRLDFAQKQIKGKAYHKLYKKGFMSIIGPEVFDRASKLPKVTSFTIMRTQPQEKSSKNNISRKYNPLNSASEISYAKMSERFSSQEEDSQEDYESRDTNRSKQESAGSSESVGKTTTTDSQNEDYDEENEPKLRKSISNNVSLKSDHQTAGDKPSIPCSPPPNEKKKVKKMPCYRKRRVRIKYIGKLKESDDIECVSTMSSFSNDSNNSSSESQPTPETDSDKDSADRRHDINRLPSDSSISSVKSDETDKRFGQDQKIYFLTELLRKPLPEILRKYYDLKNIELTQRRQSTLFQKQLDFKNNLYKMYYLKRFEEMCEFKSKLSEEKGKVWKSKVLKTAEAHQEVITGDFLTKIDHDLINKLFRYQYLFLMNKMKESKSNVRVSSLPHADAESAKGVDNKERISVELGSSKLRNELCCKSHSENSLRSRISLIGNDNDIIHDNKSNFSENASENSVEVSQKDLSFRKPNSLEKRSISLQSYSIKKKFKSSACKTNVLENEKDYYLSSESSDEPISLYYSKAANLASTLLDMKKFIYPDHIHYSYKHVNKKGFDVNISGGLPLLVQSQALSTNNNQHVDEILPKPESEITRRPMDLSFAKTDAFAGWQNSDQSVSDSPVELNKRCIPFCEDMSKRKKGSSSKKKAVDGETDSPSNKSKAENQKGLNSHHVCFTQNVICEKFNNIPDQSHKKELCRTTHDEQARTPIQISSTQLHSNKGRIGSTYNPALRLQENKKEGKKRVETQEERTKKMLARLEREILFQNKNG